MYTTRDFKTLVLAAAYAIGNCIPPAPVMMVNVLALLAPSTYKNKSIIKFSFAVGIIAICFLPFHLHASLDATSYVLSFFGFVGVMFTSLAASLYVARSGGVGRYAGSSSKLAVFFFVVSAVSLFVTGGAEFLGGWYAHSYTAGVVAYRYGGYMYEASHLCLVLAPLFFYYLTKDFWTLKRIFYLLGLFFVFISTLSLGFFATFVLTLLFVSFGELRSKSGFFRVLLYFWLFAIFAVGLYLGSDTVSVRIDNVLSGTDSSTKGRTVDAYILAAMIAEQNSIFFGVGPGQVKTIGASIIVDYYNYSPDLVRVVRIPSSAAEVLASYGLLGLSLKVLILLFFYVKTEVSKDKFRNSLFIFFFIYQFYGGFMISSIEFFCFGLAFLTRSDASATFGMAEGAPQTAKQTPNK